MHGIGDIHDSSISVVFTHDVLLVYNFNILLTQAQFWLLVGFDGRRHFIAFSFSKKE